MSALLDFTTQLSTVHCYDCGIQFAFPVDVMRRRREDGKLFWCPNGHQQHFSETAVQKLERELEQEKRRAKESAERASANHARAERLWKTYRQTSGKLSALKKRVGHGVCPACQRTVRQLARHMSTKHPGYGCNEPEVGEAKP